MFKKISLYFVEEYFLTRTVYKNFFNLKEVSKKFNVLGIYNSAEKLLQMMENKPSDVVITAIQLPFMNGFELIDSLRNRYPETKIVVISALENNSYRQEALSMGVSEYITKDVQLSEIVNSISRICSS